MISSELLQPEVLKENSFKYSVGHTDIEIINPDKFNEQYLRDVFYPQLKETEKGEPIRMEAIETVLERQTILDFVESLPQWDVEFDRGYFFGHVEGGRFVTNPEYGFINFTFEDGNKILHRFVGTGTHFALSSYTKAHVFWKFAQEHPDFMVAHSSSVVDRQTGQGIIFSTADRGIESRRSFGKTTLALSVLTRGGDRYAFASNDEVLFYPEENALGAYPLPNEISIMGSGLNQIYPGKRPELLDWREKDHIRDDVRYYTTHGALFRNNNRVGNFDQVSKWVFVSLQKDASECQIRSVPDDEARLLFDDIVFEDRMRLAFARKPYLGESAALLTYGQVPYLDSRMYFDLLKSQGVEFVQITGSVDPDKIYPKIAEII